MRSMTGFGAATLEQRGLSLRAEVRSVNHKFLQLKVRLPSELGFLEADVEELVRKRVDRGALALNVSLLGPSALETMQVDFEAARRYKRLLERLAKELDMEPQIELRALLNLPGVIHGRSDPGTLARETRQVLKVVDAALKELARMREAEGAALAADLRRNAAQIRKLLGRIDKRMPLLVKAHQEALLRRVDELLGGRGAVQPADLAREAALLADRTDVSEELARLSSHLDQLERILARDAPVGRQLDFLVQEFLREANTIGSKCNDAEVAHLVVDLKTAIERLREQVQNVE